MVGADDSLSLQNLLQQLLQTGNHLSLLNGRSRVSRRFKFLARFVDVRAGFFFLQDDQAFAGSLTDRAAPLADVGQRLDQMQKQLLDVSLILDCPHGGGFLLCRRQFGKLLRRVHRFGFKLDETLHLLGDLSVLQSLQEVLPFDGQLDDDLSDCCACFDESGFAFRARLDVLRVQEELHNVGHFVVDELADVLLHAADFAVDRQLGEAVVLKLAELHRDRRRDQLLSHRPGPLLVNLLPPQRELVDRPKRNDQREDQQERHKRTRRVSLHFDSPKGEASWPYGG